jgi:hypothetical protein
MAFSYASALKKPIQKKEEIVEESPMGKQPNANNQDCIICYGPSFLPTRMQIHNTEGVSKQCDATVCNPCCLTCLRDLISSQIGSQIKCPFGCCVGYKHSKTYLNYGVLPRLPVEEAEYQLWHQQFKLGTLNRQCTRCEHICSTFNETINHSRKDCKKRKMTCRGCHQVMAFEDIAEHFDNYDICSNPSF